MKDNSIVQEYRELVNWLNAQDDFYRAGTPQVDDATWDQTLAKLRSIERENPWIVAPDSPTQNVQYTSTHKGKARHAARMLSLDNIASLEVDTFAQNSVGTSWLNREDIRNWLGRVKKDTGLADPSFMCELKIDGVAVNLQYVHGKLVRAITRGDGTFGEDITQHIRYVKNLPLILEHLNVPDFLEVHAEVCIERDVFERLNARRDALRSEYTKALQDTGASVESVDTAIVRFSNPRNAAAGILATKFDSFFKKVAISRKAIHTIWKKVQQMESRVQKDLKKEAGCTQIEIPLFDIEEPSVNLSSGRPVTDKSPQGQPSKAAEAIEAETITAERESNLESLRAQLAARRRRLIIELATMKSALSSLSLVAHGFGLWRGGKMVKSAREVFEFFRACKIPISSFNKVCDTESEIYDYIRKFYAQEGGVTVDRPAWDTDGVVIKLNDLSLRDAVGETSRAPSWAVAYKYPPVEVFTRVLDIKIGIGRTGRATPYAELAPVRLKGTEIKKATLHNADFIKQKGITIGGWVILRKAGEVVPEIVASVQMPPAAAWSAIPGAVAAVPKLTNDSTAGTGADRGPSGLQELQAGGPLSPLRQENSRFSSFARGRNWGNGAAGEGGAPAAPSAAFEMPTSCPECASPLAPFKDQDVDLRCTNARFCQGQVRARLEYIASRGVLNIQAIGPKAVQWLVSPPSKSARAIIKDGSELFLLRGSADADKNCLMPDSFTQKAFIDNLGLLQVSIDKSTTWPQVSAGQRIVDNPFFTIKKLQSGVEIYYPSKTLQKLLQQLDTARRAEMWRLILALNIRHVGPYVAKLISNRFEGIDQIIQADRQVLLSIRGVGETVADSIIEYFKTPWSVELVRMWQSSGVRF